MLAATPNIIIPYKIWLTAWVDLLSQLIHRISPKFRSTHLILATANLQELFDFPIYLSNFILWVELYLQLCVILDIFLLIFFACYWVVRVLEFWEVATLDTWCTFALNALRFKVFPVFLALIFVEVAFITKALFSKVMLPNYFHYTPEPSPLTTCSILREQLFQFRHIMFCGKPTKWSHTQLFGIWNHRWSVIEIQNQFFCV